MVTPENTIPKSAITCCFDIIRVSNLIH